MIINASSFDSCWYWKVKQHGERRNQLRGDSCSWYFSMVRAHSQRACTNQHTEEHVVPIPDAPCRKSFRSSLYVNRPLIYLPSPGCLWPRFPVTFGTFTSAGPFAIPECEYARVHGIPSCQMDGRIIRHPLDDRSESRCMLCTMKRLSHHQFRLRCCCHKPDLKVPR